MLAHMSKHRVIIPKGFEMYYEQFHFAPAVRVGKTVYCSGQVGWDGATATPSPDPKTQFVLAFDNLRRVLEAAGAEFSDVVEITTFHVGMEHIGLFGKVKDEHLKTPYPAWTAIGVAGLFMPGLLVEIRATARL